MKTVRLFISLIICSLLTVQATLAQTTHQERKEFNKMIDEKGNFSKDYMRFSAKYVNGDPINSEMLKGTSVFYVFGGSDCSPCIALGKIIASLIEEKRYEGEKMEFLFITSDDEKGINLLVNKFGLNPDHLVYLPKEQAEEVGLITQIRPTFLLTDRTGKVVFKSVGFFGYKEMDLAQRKFEESVIPKIDELLDKQKKEYAPTWLYNLQNKYL